MMDERLQDQAAAYVAGALPDAERQVFEDQLRGNDELRRYTAELREVTERFAELLPPVTPSPSIKEAVMREIAPKAHHSNWVPWAIAAALAIFAGLTMLEHDSLRQQNTTLQANVDLAQLELSMLRATEGGPQGASAMIAWDNSAQSGMIKVTNLPAPVQGKDYQLWVICPAQQTPIAAGILRVRADGVAEIQFRPTKQVTRAENFAVSLEREGGAPVNSGPEGQILMIGQGT